MASQYNNFDKSPQKSVETDQNKTDPQNDNQTTKNRPFSNQSTIHQPYSNQSTTTESLNSNQPTTVTPNSNQPIKDLPNSNQPIKDLPNSNQPTNDPPNSNQPIKDSLNSNQTTRVTPNSNQTTTDTQNSNQTIPIANSCDTRETEKSIVRPLLTEPQIDNFQLPIQILTLNSWIEILESSGLPRDFSIYSIHQTGYIGFEEAIEFAQTNIENYITGTFQSEINLIIDSIYQMGGVNSLVNSRSLAVSSVKMCFVVNMTLKMGTGKIAAQVAHACLDLYREIIKDRNIIDDFHKWELYGQTKVVLKCRNAEDLLDICQKAQEKGIKASLINDAGRTQIERGSITVLGIFGEENLINSLTGHLKLL